MELDELSDSAPEIKIKYLTLGGALYLKPWGRFEISSFSDNVLNNQEEKEAGYLLTNDYNSFCIKNDIL